MSNIGTMISSEDLKKWLGMPDLTILDASWYLPDEGRDAHGEFCEEHIPGAQFFDIDTICDQSNSCPHMLPQPEVFAIAVSQLGVKSNTRVVVYDGKGLFSAPRVWWMFRVFGHDKIHVLEGGFPAWRASGGAVTTEPSIVSNSTKSFIPAYQPCWVADVETVKSHLRSGVVPIIDARSPERFSGVERDPRPEVREGHIPGSLNLHYARLLEGEPTVLKSADQLSNMFESVGAGIGRSIVTTCGSGISACILALAFHQLSREPVAVYDGSWAEWGSRADCPVERG